MRLGLGLSLAAINSGRFQVNPSLYGTVLLDWNPSNVASVTLNSGNVSALADSSGGTFDANKTAVQATPAAQPTYTAADSGYNNWATISSITSTKWLEPAGDWASIAAQPNTIFMVGDDGGSATSRILDGGNNGRNLIEALSSAWNIYAGTAFVPSGVANAGSKQVVCGLFNGASSKIWVSDSRVTATATGNPGTQGIARMCLGAFQGGTAVTAFKLARALVFSGAMSDANRAALTQALGTMYNVTVA